MNPGRISREDLTSASHPAVGSWWGCLARVAFLLAASLALAPRPAGAADAPDYSEVDAIFRKHCLDCHATQEPEGKLVLETHAALMKGGESGSVVKPGRGRESLLVVAVEAGLERDGKRKQMPPGKRDKLKPEEIAILKGWIDAGALPPKEGDAAVLRDPVIPRIQPATPPPRAIRALAFSGALKLLALGRHGEVELVSPDSRETVRRLPGIRGAVNALAFSADGRTLAVAAGEPALFGQATIWDVAEGKLRRTIEGHTDSLYSIALSPDSQTLATGSYDQKIKLWDPATGQLRHTLSAHNAAIYGLAFRPDGRILASASGDRTVKLWQTSTGKRVETLSQPLKEVSALAWSPDGRRLAAAGSDNRIRVWEVSEAATETTNPLLISKFAHEGSLLNLLWSKDGKSLLSSADDLTVKVWDAAQVTERKSLARQPDVASALAFLDEGRRAAIGRMDGSWQVFDLEKGMAQKPLVPGLTLVAPRGLAIGTSGRFKLTGTNLAGVTNLRASHAGLRLQFETATANSIEATLHAGADVPRGAHEIWAAGPGGEGSRVKLFVDNVPQRLAPQATDAALLPVAWWGAIERSSEVDEFQFKAQASQTVVLELAARSVGSKMQNGAVALLDDRGVPLALEGGFDGADRAVSARIPADGIYTARVTDQMLMASSEHFYRLTVGALPFVTGVFPLSIPTNAETEVQLAGYNLPDPARVRIRSGGEGEVEVPLDGQRFRAVRSFKVSAVSGPHQIEVEPNNRPDAAMTVAVPGSVHGRIGTAGDEDLFRFEARRGQPLVLETEAARRGSPVDTRIEVLRPDGQPVPRLLLQAVRNTAINFRGVDSNGTGIRLDNYEEMELNEYLYLNGDVMRLFRMPQGPDSDMLMYTSGGKRQAFFDTTAVSHALDEQGFIVEPHAAGTKLVPNGLPVFTLNHENDDDAARRLGSDSKLTFTAPADGVYLARLTDSRGHAGDTCSYRLTIRPARPDFTVSLAGANPTVSPGSGQSFTVTAERLDEFDGEIRVTISGLPPGFSASSPLIIEAGQTEAKGTIVAALNAPAPDGTNATTSKVTAEATVGGRVVTKEVNSLGTIRLGAPPKLYVGLEPFQETSTNQFDPAKAPGGLVELTIGPGETIPAWLKVRRNGHKELVTFFAENLPHGVIVADIGLNGVLIPKEESERKIFFNAARWVPEQDRLFYLIEQQAGRQTSRPAVLKVRRGRPAAVP